MLEKLDVSMQAEYLRLLATYVPAVLFIINDCGEPAFISQQWFASTGLDWEQTLAGEWRLLVHPADLAGCAVMWERAKVENCPQRAEIRIKNATNSIYQWHIAQLIPVIEGEEPPRKWVGVLTNVTEQKNAEGLLQLVINTIPGCIWWKDKDSRYLGSNKKNASRAGFADPASIVGKSDRELVWKDQADVFRQNDLRVMETNKPEYHIIERITLADGRLAWLDTSKVPLHDADGNVVGTVGSYEDITERVLLEQQREDFMASLAHDLKVPIVGAWRALEALQAGSVGPLNEAQSKLIGQIVSSQRHVLDMVQNLLQVLRYEASGGEVFLAPCNISHVVRACVSDLKHLFLQKELEVELDAPSALVMMADEAAMQRLVMNLLGNAIKFTPVRGRIAVSVESLDHMVRIKVSDNGVGISKEDQERLFRRFFQGGKTKQHAAETGLGLYLCRQIAEGHGGKISVESSEGNGSTFIVVVPADGSDKKQPQDSMSNRERH
ncbi:MAG TPA: ATP-binding protein [Oculatellaceae cyanobacterium]